MAQQKGVTPYSTAKRLVDAGLMDEQALAAGIEQGTIAQKPTSRNYGEDQPMYEALQKYVDEINTRTVGVNFSVTSRKKATGEGETG